MTKAQKRKWIYYNAVTNKLILAMFNPIEAQDILNYAYWTSYIGEL